ncbi:MAG: stage II sporulation protein M [Candidatus Woesearchaeota archaeon]
MIIESLFNPKLVNKNYNVLFFIGLIYTSLAIGLSIFVFRSEASMVMVFFTVLSVLPYVFASIKHEEEEDMELEEESSILKEHAKTLTKFMLVFFGMVLAFAIWYVVLPQETAGHVFNTQISTINAINSNATGRVIESVTGNLVSRLDIFQRIVMNNLVVLFFCLLFSFLFGFGAIFILTWNASVIGTAIGTIIKSGFEKAAMLIGFEKAVQYFHVITYGLLRYAIHGIPEILSYFVAGLAGGIISVAAIKHDFRSKKYHKIIIDSADLIIIAIILVFISGILEVYVTPAFF